MRTIGVFSVLNIMRDTIDDDRIEQLLTVAHSFSSDESLANPIHPSSPSHIPAIQPPSLIGTSNQLSTLRRMHGFNCSTPKQGNAEAVARKQAFLWTAPEILRIIPTNMAELPKEMAQRADIYSLGTLLYEIYGRQGPYGDDLIDTSQIISALKSGSVDGVVSRPDISLIRKAPKEIQDMVSRCWNEDPKRRPLINKIKDKVAKVNNGKRTNIADNIMELLDRYKYNLTDMIE
ncbi:hypothetical protein PRIPAC_95483 [Pristionchus pacificus]|uniref:guanylate cyclase n=1 Tax=Pristionchus pacificus TaxID=54126 RepID=A0A2A6BC73_PRIPA|nr:hypothetical protein PRIPAC_95483 [Pristionchus pacificus]|eukprot:PDM63466.1 protein kinase [Pristionchus pacificus]